MRDGEVWLHNMHIAPYAPAAGEGHDPERPRKLLMHQKEIERLIGKTQEQGLTLVPTRIYFSGPRAKVELALARGKEQRDKREAIREREQSREMERALRYRNRYRRDRGWPGRLCSSAARSARKAVESSGRYHHRALVAQRAAPRRRIGLPLRCAAVSLSGA